MRRLFSHISAAVTISPIDFNCQLENFLRTEDESDPLEEAAVAPTWSSPRLPRKERKVGVQKYLADVLDLADEQQLRKKRVRVSAVPHMD
jgi:hypothetical protein